MAVALEHGVNLDFANVPDGGEIRQQHYAFLVSEEDFDAIYGKIASRGLQHWADPGQNRPGEINHRHGGRGVYFPDPSGHAMEIFTRPYELVDRPLRAVPHALLTPIIIGHLGDVAGQRASRDVGQRCFL
jgi:hypothetical protein